MRHIYRLTRSQQMAIVDILIAYIRDGDGPQEFINVSTDETTTPGELLALFASFDEMEQTDAPTLTGIQQ